MDLKLHYTARPGYTQLVTPGEQPVEELDFGMLRIGAGERHELRRAGY